MLPELATGGIPCTPALWAMGGTTLPITCSRIKGSSHLSLRSSEHAAPMPWAPPCPPGNFLHVLEEKPSLLILTILSSSPMGLLLLLALPHLHRANGTCHSICSCLCPAKLRDLYSRSTLVSFLSPAPYTADDGLMEEWMKLPQSSFWPWISGVMM